MYKRAFVVLVALIVTTLSSFVFMTGGGAARGDDEVIPGKYIVVLRDDVQDVPGQVGHLAGKHGLSPEHVYQAALKGFAAGMSAQRAAAVAAEPGVAFVSPDRVVHAFPEAAGKSGSAATQPAQSVPTGVRRVGLNATNKGAGIGVAVIDTGIDLGHPDLKANIAGNVTFVWGTKNGNDDNGHGSHVAGTIAALDNNGIGVVGVAPQAKLYAVKVLNRNGSGTWSGVIAGVDWVTQRASAIRVANMSLGGGGSSDNNCGNSNNDALHKAICKSVAAGITYVVAAGNSGANASGSVPAAYEEVITVSAIVDSNGQPGGGGPGTSWGADDTFASFSNYGSVVDIAGPGVNILSTWKGGGYNTISGTSMATPHVSGAAALYIKTHSGASPSAVQQALVQAANTAQYCQGSLQACPYGFLPGPADGVAEPLVYAAGF